MTAGLLIVLAISIVPTGIAVGRHADPTSVLTAEADWRMRWYHYAVIIAIGLVMAGFALSMLR
jgi:hypothetical protein